MRSLRQVRPRFLHRRQPELAGLIILAAVLEIGAAVGISYVAGWHEVESTIDRFSWPWILATVGGLALSFFGYYFAYRGIYRTEDGPDLSRHDLRAVVVAGFGGFLSHTGAAVDHFALRAAGSDDRDARVRVAALGGLEHGVLSLFGCAAGIVILSLGLAAPPLDVNLPWAVIPVPGFLIAFFLAERYREGLRSESGLRRRLGVFLDSIHLIKEMFRHPIRTGGAPAGMALFWLSEGFCAWAALASFGVRMNGAQFTVGLATGMLFTRRTGPLAGAGILMVVLPLTLWYSGAPLATAVSGIFVYRMLSLWLPMPVSLASLATLRRLGRESGLDGGESESEPALSRRAG